MKKGLCVLIIMFFNIGQFMGQMLEFTNLNKNSIEICKDGIAKEVWYYDNGNVKQTGTYLYGKKYGKWVEYYSNKAKKSVKFYDEVGNPSGKWTTYYPNGEKWNASMYTNGKLDGVWVYWYSNGKKWHQLTYAEGELNGKWNFWDNQGKLNGKGIYKSLSTDNSGIAAAY